MSNSPLSIISPFKGVRPKIGIPFKIESGLVVPESIHTENFYIYKEHDEYIKILMQNGWLIQDLEPCYYVFQIWNNVKTHTGLIANTLSSAYKYGKIRQHEKTLSSKLSFLKGRFEYNRIQINPVMLLHKNSSHVKNVLSNITEKMYDFQVAYENPYSLIKFWAIRDKKNINLITQAYSTINDLYLGDGHHRSSCLAFMSDNEEINTPIMVALFDEDNIETKAFQKEFFYPDSISSESILNMFSQYFKIERLSDFGEKNQEQHNILSINKKYYNMSLHQKSLDLSPSQAYFETNNCLERVFCKIKEFGILLSHNKNIPQMISLNDSKYDYKCFTVTIPSISINSFFEIVDKNVLLPVQSTCFEPKLPNGLVTNLLTKVYINNVVNQPFKKSIQK